MKLEMPVTAGHKFCNCIMRAMKKLEKTSDSARPYGGHG